MQDLRTDINTTMMPLSNTILTAISNHYNIPLTEICNKHRKHAKIRQICMLALRLYVPYITQAETARLLGKKDHTTVGHAERVTVLPSEVHEICKKLLPLHN
jgi:chromosomal replication initiation ATPase DnaA